MSKLKLVIFSTLVLLATISITRADTLLGTYSLTRYYSPAVGQTTYYKDRGYDIMMNCGGISEEGCKYPADGGLLTEEDIGRAFACPKTIPLGTKIRLVFHRGEVQGVCRDRGGAIKNLRLDSRCGYGDEGVANIRENKNCYTGKAKVYKINTIEPPLSNNIAEPTTTQEPKGTPNIKITKECYQTDTIKEDNSYVQVDRIQQFFNWIIGLKKNDTIRICKDL